jgi:hypothetical protein
MPRASALLRMLAFAVPVALALAGVQPFLGAITGTLPVRWAISLTAPAIIAAVLIFAVARITDRGNALQPPWYSAWALLPGAFLLAGAAAMCIFGALVELAAIRTAMWVLLIAGAVLWLVGMTLVRRGSR